MPTVMIHSASTQHNKYRPVADILDSFFDARARADSGINSYIRDLKRDQIVHFPIEFRAVVSAVINDYLADQLLRYKIPPEAHFGGYFVFNIERTREEKEVLKALVTSLSTANPSAQITDDLVLNLLMHFESNLPKKEGLTLITRDFGFHIKNGMKSVHSLRYDEDLITFPPKEVLANEKQEIAEIIADIDRQALLIGDLEMHEMLTTPDNVVVKKANLRNVLGLAQGSTEVVLSENLLASSTLRLGDAHLILRHTLIHEFNHLLDERNRRLLPNASADQKERSAMMRTAAYYNGQILTDATRFLVLSYFPDGRHMMETTIESNMDVGTDVVAGLKEKNPLSYYFKQVSPGPYSCDLCKFRLSPLAS